MFRIVCGIVVGITVTITVMLHREKLYTPKQKTPTSVTPTRRSVEFPEQLNTLFQKSLEEPCKTDYFIEAWWGVGSKLNIYSYLMIDAFLSNKTASLWYNKNDKRHSQLAIFVLETFDNVPICTSDEHTGVFHNDGKNLKSYKKLGISYEKLMDLLGGTMHYLFDNIKPNIKLLATNILKTIPKPFYTVFVRWGDKLNHESHKLELPIYVNAVKSHPKPAMVQMMSLEDVSYKFGKMSKIRTVNYHENILVEILIAAEADIVFGTESSNIFRVIYKIREGRNLVNIEDLQGKKKYPIRIWLTKFKKLLRRII